MPKGRVRRSPPSSLSSLLVVVARVCLTTHRSSFELEAVHAHDLPLLLLLGQLPCSSSEAKKDRAGRSDPYPFHSLHPLSHRRHHCATQARS